MRNIFQLTLTINDFKLLMKYYFTAGLSAFNKKKLFNELNDAKIVSNDNLPLNVACQGSNILVRNIGKHQTFSVHIVDQSPDPVKLNKILISDPLSIALLGYANGQKTEWEMGGAIQQYELVSVRQCTEEAATAGSKTEHLPVDG